jgi:oxygen-independent coproporphyrinogen III oxidase
LRCNGLAQYEISNFVRDGAESIHNKKYWLRCAYLGLGVDAHTMLRSEDGRAIRFATTDDLQGYLNAPGWDDRHPLTMQEEMEEAWFLGLRLNAGIDLQRLEDEFGREAMTTYRPIVDELIEDGLLRMTENTVALTARGRLLSNEVFTQFFCEPATV